MSNSIHIAPFFLARVAGFPFEYIHQLELSNTITLLKQQVKLKVNLNLKGDALLQYLDLYIQQNTGQDKIFFINLKRDIYNKRIIKNKVFNRIYDKQLYKTILAHNRLIKENENLTQKIEQEYQKERNAFQPFLNQILQNLQQTNTLELSAPSLCRIDLRKLKTGTKKYRQTELAIWKYLSRSATKTTPFGDFTSVNQGYLYDNLNYTELLTSITERHTIINPSILQLIQNILLEYPSFYTQTKLCLNPSIHHRNATYWKYLNEGTYAEFEKDELSQWIFDYFEYQEKPIIFTDLINDISKGIEASESMITDYVLQLIDYRFLEWELPALTKNWLEDWLTFLHNYNFNDKPLEELKTALQILYYRLLEFNQFTGFNSFLFFEKDIKRLENSLSNILQHETSRTMDKGYPQDIELNRKYFFYQDVLNKYKVQSNKHQIGLIIENLNELMQYLEIFQDRLEEEKRLVFFLENYNSDEKVDLMAFYELYIKEKLNSTLLQDQIEFNIPTHTNHIVELGEQHFQQNGIYKNVELGNSYSCLFQIIPVKGTDKLEAVINETAIGYGKLASRFSNHFEDLTSTPFEDNEQEIWVENTDNDISNLHFRPSTLSYELEVSTNQNTYTNEKININSIEVGILDSALVLFSKSDNRRIYPFNLGLKSKYQRSDFFQFLDFFSKTKRIALKPFLKILNISLQQQQAEGITYCPTVMYKNLVLQRAFWKIDSSVIPEREKGMNEATYFSKIYNWTNTRKLPRYAFLRRWNNKKVNSPNNTHKPQFIDFHNPIAVSLFEKFVRKNTDGIVLEIFLPSYEDLLQYKNERYATEFLVEWTV